MQHLSVHSAGSHNGELGETVVKEAIIDFNGLSRSTNPGPAPLQEFSGLFPLRLNDSLRRYNKQT